MPIETPLKHLSLLSLVFLNNASFVPFFTYLLSYLYISISTTRDLCLVYPKDLIPLLKFLVYILKYLSILKLTILL
jgi:hypothetical protein